MIPRLNRQLRRRTQLAAWISTVLCHGLLSPSQAAITADNFSDGWVQTDSPLDIRFDSGDLPHEGNLRILLGQTDVTPLGKFIAPGLLRLDLGALRLPSGEQELILYRVQSQEQWNELVRFPVKVLTAAGFETSEVTKRLAVTTKGQWDEGHHGDAAAPARATYQDLAVQAGVSTRHTRKDREIRTHANVVSSSVRGEALRFYELGEDAYKTDLADYLVEFESDRTHLAVGHISYGNNSLLLNNVSNRGLWLRHQLGDRADISVNRMNGSRVVGFNNLLGLSSSDHSISAATVGYEALRERPGGLRVELMYLDATVQNMVGFNFGQVPDAEKNSGWGLTVIGTTADGRWRANTSFARSTYTNPDDPLLSLGQTLVAVQATTNNARHLDVAYNLVQNKMLGEQPLTVSLQVTHDRTDPLYKAVGAYAQADFQQNQIHLNSQLGPITARLLHSRGEDNLDDIPTILKTRTERSGFNASLPFASLLSDPSQPNLWLPNVSYSYDYVHQYAANIPDPVNSGFNSASHLPDQVNRVHGLNLNWSIASWSLAYRFSASEQDNRQLGREGADFRNYGNDISLGAYLGKLSANVSLGRQRNVNEEQDLTNYTDNGSFSFNYRISNRWSLSSSYSQTRGHDQLGSSESRGETANLQAAGGFDLPLGARKVPAQLGFSYSWQDSDNVNSLFNFQSAARYWTFNSTLTFRFY